MTAAPACCPCAPLPERCAGSAAPSRWTARLGSYCRRARAAGRAPAQRGRRLQCGPRAVSGRVSRHASAHGGRCAPGPRTPLLRTPGARGRGPRARDPCCIQPRPGGRATGLGAGSQGLEQPGTRAVVVPSRLLCALAEPRGPFAKQF